MPRAPFVVGVSDLRRRLGAQRDVRVEGTLAGLEISSARVHGDDVAFEGLLESIEGGITATGVVSTRWSGACRRCLEEMGGRIEAEVREVFEHHPAEGETYPIHGDEVDLEPVVRDAVLLALPLAPLCRPDCPGPAPDAFPTGPAAEREADEDEPEPRGDPRWAALDELRFE